MKEYRTVALLLLLLAFISGCAVRPGRVGGAAVPDRPPSSGGALGGALPDSPPSGGRVPGSSLLDEQPVGGRVPGVLPPAAQSSKVIKVAVEVGNEIVVSIASELLVQLGEHVISEIQNVRSREDDRILIIVVDEKVFFYKIDRDYNYSIDDSKVIGYIVEQKEEFIDGDIIIKLTSNINIAGMWLGEFSNGTKATVTILQDQNGFITAIENDITVEGVKKVYYWQGEFRENILSYTDRDDKGATGSGRLQYSYSDNSHYLRGLWTHNNGNETLQLSLKRIEGQ